MKNCEYFCLKHVDD